MTEFECELLDVLRKIDSTSMSRRIIDLEKNVHERIDEFVEKQIKINEQFIVALKEVKELLTQLTKTM